MSVWLYLFMIQIFEKQHHQTLKISIEFSGIQCMLMIDLAILKVMPLR
jgi:hypothetical protein